MDRIIQHRIAIQRQSPSMRPFFSIIKEIAQLSKSIDFEASIERLNEIKAEIYSLPDKQMRVAMQIARAKDFLLEELNGKEIINEMVENAKLRQAFRRQVGSGGYVKFLKENAI